MRRILCWLGFHQWWPNEPDRKYLTVWRDGLPDYLCRMCTCGREETIKIERPIGKE